MASQVTSAPSKTNRYESYVDDQLEKTRARIKIVDLCTGIFALVGWVLGVLLFFTIIDSWIWTLGTFGRTIALVVLLGGVGAIGVFYIAPLFLRKINPQYAARMIEQARPKFKNSILNYLWTRSANRKVNKSVAVELSQQAASDISEVTATESVDQSNLIRTGFIVVGLAVLAVGYCILSPKSPLPTLTRVLSPFSEISRPAIVRVVSVTPGDTEIFFGDTLPVTAEIRGNHDPEDVVLVYSTDDGQHTNVPIPMNAEGPFRYEVALKTSGTGIQQNLKYQVIARDGESPWYSVKVKPQPAVLIKSLKLVPPKYTQLAERIVTGTGEVDGVEGTRVFIEAAANLPIQNAYVEFLKPDRNEPDNLIVVKTGDMDFTDQDISGSFLLTLNAERDGPFCTHYQIRYQSSDGDLNSKPNVYPIRITPDFAPELHVLEPRSNEILLPVNGSIAIQVEATDVDYEISGLGLQLANQGIRILNHEFEIPQDDRRRVRQTYWLVPEKLSLEPGDKATFFATAADNRHSPYGDILDPNITRSENFTITITETDTSIDEEKRDEEIERAEQEQQQNNQDDADQENQQEKNQNEGDSSSEQEQNGTEGEQQDGSEQNTDDTEPNNENDQESNGGQDDSEGSGTSDPKEDDDPSQQESDGKNSSGGSSDGSSNPQESNTDPSNQENENNQNDGAGTDSTQENDSGQGNGSNPQESDGSQGDSSQQGTGQGQSESSDQGPRENSDGTNGDPNQGNPENSTAGDNTQGQQNDAQGDGQRDNNLQDGSISEDAPEGERVEEILKYRGEKENEEQSESNNPSENNDGNQENTSDQADSGDNPSQNNTDPGNQSADPTNPENQNGDEKDPSDSEGSGGNEQSEQNDSTNTDPNQNGTGSEGDNSNEQDPNQSGDPDQQNSNNQQSSAESDSSQDDQEGNNSSDNNAGENSSDNPSGDQGQDSSGDQNPTGNQDPTGNQEQSGNESDGSDPNQSSEGNGESEANGEQESGNQGNPSEQSGNTESGQANTASQDASPAQSETSQSSGTTSGEGATDYGQSPTGDPTGTGNPDNNPDARPLTDREFEQAKREQENIEHAKHAADLVIDELRKQAADPDPELLERLNWTPEELRDFLKSWEQMKEAAKNGGAREKRLYESRLKSLGLKPSNPAARQLNGEQDGMFGLSEEGAVNRPPADWSERYNRFQRLRNRVERE